MYVIIMKKSSRFVYLTSLLSLLYHIRTFCSSSPLVNKLMPDAFPNDYYHLILTQGKDDKKEGKAICRFLYQILKQVKYWSLF